jgi:putative peptidoglycan lipid II flippase
LSQARTIGLLTSLNMLTAAVGVLSIVVVAHLFGTGREIELYLAAVGLHASVASLAQTGQVSEVLLPAYHLFRTSDGRQEAFRSFSAAINRFLLLLLLVAMVAWFFAEPLMAIRIPGFGAGDIAAAAEMFRWILPLLILQVATELFKTLANAERLFGRPELVTLLARVVSVLMIVTLAGGLGAWALVAALWGAALIECAGILWLLRRHGFRHSLIVSQSTDAAPLHLFRRLATTLPHVGATQVFLFALDAALSMLPAGSFAIFRYVSMIWARTQGIFVRPVAVPFFTIFSEASSLEPQRRGELLQQALSQMVAVTALVSAAVITGGQLLLTGLWAGERFHPDQVRAAAWLLAGLFTLLPLAGAAALWRKASVSLHLLWETYLALSLVQLVSAGLALLVVPQFGLPGALAVSAANLLGFAGAPWWVLKIRGHRLIAAPPVDRFWKWAIAVSVAVPVGYGLFHWSPLASLTLGGDRLLAITAGVAAGGIAASITLLVGLSLRIPEAVFVADLGGRLLRSAQRGS